MNNLKVTFLKDLEIIICSQLNGFKFRKWLHISIYLIDGTLKGTTTLGQSRPGSKSNEGVLYIPQNFKIGAWSSGGLASYAGHSLVMSYPSAEM